MHPILKKLEGGDRRSTGKADEVADQLCRSPDLIGVVLEGVLDPDIVVAMRATDAVEKATRKNWGALEAHRAMILGPMAEVQIQEVRWHWAQLVSRIELTSKELAGVVPRLEKSLTGKSRILRVNCLQGLTNLALRHPEIRPKVESLVVSALDSESPAVRARARMLVVQLGIEM